MSEQVRARTPWDAIEYMVYGTIAGIIGGFLLFVGLDVGGDGSEYALYAGWAIAAVGGILFQIGVIAKAVQVGMTGMTLD